VGVSTIGVLVNRLGTMTGEELPGRWVCRPENRPSMEVRFGMVDEKVDGKEVHAPQPDLIRRQSSPRRPDELVWKRKADEAGSSFGAGDGMTMLVGSLPCQLPVEGKRSRRQEPNHHMEEQMLQASSNTPDGRAKWPQLMSVEGREIIGPGFCPGPRVCAA
jgi:hypothetical protein